MIPGVGGDAYDIRGVDSVYDGDGMLMLWKAQGLGRGSTDLGGELEGYCCPYNNDRFVFEGAAKGFAVDGSADFFIKGYM